MGPKSPNRNKVYYQSAEGEGGGMQGATDAPSIPPPIRPGTAPPHLLENWKLSKGGSRSTEVTGEEVSENWGREEGLEGTDTT